VGVPARAAYSHSASVRSRYSLLVNHESQPIYCVASSQLTLITGICPRPQRSATRWHVPASAQASHSANVASNLETANGLAILTSCCGTSLVDLPGSSSGEHFIGKRLVAQVVVLAGHGFALSFFRREGDLASLPLRPLHRAAILAHRSPRALTSAAHDDRKTIIGRGAVCQ
jgi:hypothetical protein